MGGRQLRHLRPTWCLLEPPSRDAPPPSSADTRGSVVGNGRTYCGVPLHESNHTFHETAPRRKSPSPLRCITLTSFSLGLHALAIFWLGIMAGFFGTYSANVTQALLQVDGSVYAVIQGELNRAVRHALFFAFFFLPPVWCLLSVVVGWRSRGLWSWLLLGAAVLYVAGVIALTRQVNLPLNS